MFKDDAIESIPTDDKQSDELPEKDNLVGFFALLIEVDKRINDKATI